MVFLSKNKLFHSRLILNCLLGPRFGFAHRQASPLKSTFCTLNVGPGSKGSQVQELSDLDLIQVKYLLGEDGFDYLLQDELSPQVRNYLSLIPSHQVIPLLRNHSFDNSWVPAFLVSDGNLILPVEGLPLISFPLIKQFVEGGCRRGVDRIHNLKVGNFR